MGDQVPAELLSAAQAERDHFREVLAKRSLDQALAAMEGLELLLDRAEAGDIAALGAVQRWRRIIERLRPGREIHIPNGRAL